MEEVNLCGLAAKGQGARAREARTRRGQTRKQQETQRIWSQVRKREGEGKRGKETKRGRKTNKTGEMETENKRQTEMRESQKERHRETDRGEEREVEKHRTWRWRKTPQTGPGQPGRGAEGLHLLIPPPHDVPRPRGTAVGPRAGPTWRTSGWPLVPPPGVHLLSRTRSISLSTPPLPGLSMSLLEPLYCALCPKAPGCHGGVGEGH